MFYEDPQSHAAKVQMLKEFPALQGMCVFTGSVDYFEPLARQGLLVSSSGWDRPAHMYLQQRMWKATATYVRWVDRQQPFDALNENETDYTGRSHWSLKSEDVGVVVGAPPPHAGIPPSQFLWGLNQAEGMGPLVHAQSGAPLPYSHGRLTAAELALLRDEIGINSIRVFVHPTLLGIPQKTWDGPESIRYSDYEGSFNFSQLDLLVEPIIKAGLFLIVLPLPVDEYVNSLWAPDLHFLDNATLGRNYTGISAVKELTAFSVAVAGHLQKTTNGTFGVVFTEMCGQSRANLTERSDEKGRWQSMRDALAKVAPMAEVFGPEICLSLQWYAALTDDQPNTCKRNFTTLRNPVNYDTLPNYAEMFDSPAYSFYELAYLGAPDRTPEEACGISETIAIVDTVREAATPLICPTAALDMSLPAIAGVVDCRAEYPWQALAMERARLG